MIDSPKEKAEKAMALRRLVAKWFKKQDTQKKANLLTAKNPELRIIRSNNTKKASRA